MYPGRNFPPRRQNRRENVNESIRVREVRAVFPDGTTEVMPTSAALRKAQELGLDLVLIARVPALQRGCDFLINVSNGAHDALSAKSFLVAVAQFPRFMLAGARAARNGRPTKRAAFQSHLGFDRRITTRIENLARVNCNDRRLRHQAIRLVQFRAADN